MTGGASHRSKFVFSPIAAYTMGHLPRILAEKEACAVEQFYSTIGPLAPMSSLRMIAEKARVVQNERLPAGNGIRRGLLLLHQCA